MSQTADEKLTSFIHGHLAAEYKYSARKWTVVEVMARKTPDYAFDKLAADLPDFLSRLVQECPKDQIEVSKKGRNDEIWKDFYKKTEE